MKKGEVLNIFQFLGQKKGRWIHIYLLNTITKTNLNY